MTRPPQARFSITSWRHHTAPQAQSLEITLCSRGEVPIRMMEALKLIFNRAPEGATLDLSLGPRQFEMDPPEPVLLTFGEALEVLKNGGRVRRKIWFTKYTLSFYNPDVKNLPEDLGRVWLHELTMGRRDCTIWTPNVEELFATDWIAIP